MAAKPRARRITTPGHAAVAHDQVGADADARVTGTSAGSAREERREVVRVGRPEQHLGRAADAEPGEAARAAHRPCRRPRSGGQALDQMRRLRPRAIMPRLTARGGCPACSAGELAAGSACAQA